MRPAGALAGQPPQHASVQSRSHRAHYSLQTAWHHVWLTLPLKSAVWALTAAVGTALLPPLAARRHRVSLQQCAAAEQHYAAVVRGISTVLSLVLPPFAGSFLWGQQLPGAASYHLLSTALQLAFSLAAPLAILAARERAARLAFAQQRSMRQAEAELCQRGELCCFATLAWAVMCGMLLWAMALAVIARPS